MIVDPSAMAAQIAGQPPPTPEELRSAYRGDLATEEMPKGFTAKRRITALVHDILVRENNFLVTGDEGLAALGLSRIEILPSIPNPKKPKEQIPNPQFSTRSMSMCMPTIAQVLVLLSCEEDDLFLYDEDPKAFRRAVQEYRNKRQPQEILDCFGGVELELKKVRDSSGVVKSNEDTMEKEKQLGET